MADEKKNGNGNGYFKTVATVVLTAMVTALFTLLMNSKANERQIVENSEAVRDLQKRMIIVETDKATLRAELSALQSKVNDIWSVVVLGQRPPGR